jgi:hypothetical protein
LEACSTESASHWILLCPETGTTLQNFLVCSNFVARGNLKERCMCVCVWGGGGEGREGGV